MALPDPTRYLPLNPFAEVSVEEKQVWGRAPWRDIPQIHAGPTQILNEALAAVRTRGRSQACLLIGAPGSGKTQLVARLRQEHAPGILFVDASQPPAHASSLTPYLLRSTIESLNQPARLPNGQEADFTQLQRLAYALLKRVVEQDVSVEELHEAWLQHTAEERLAVVQEATTHLVEENAQAPAAFIQVLMTSLLPDRRRIAPEWLAGNAFWTQEALTALGVQAPLARADFNSVLQWLGILARQVQLPLVLVMDYWDITSSPVLLKELPRLVTNLLEKGRDWLILATLTPEQLTVWRQALPADTQGSLALLDEVHPHDKSWWLSSLKSLTPAEQLQLLRDGLASDVLSKQRNDDGIVSNLFPFSSPEILNLMDGAPQAGSLIARARDRYHALLQPAALPLSLFASLHATLVEQAAWSAQKDHAPDAVDLGERLVDLARLLTKNALAIHGGTLHKNVPQFDGLDLQVEIGPQKFRLVTCHATSPCWDEVLEQLTSANPASTLLCRYAQWPILGKEANERLLQFQSSGGHFHWVTATEWHHLSALGRILSSLRAGRLTYSATEPATGKAPVTYTLRRLKDLQNLPIVDLLRRIWRTQRRSIGAPALRLESELDQVLHTAMTIERETSVQVTCVEVTHEMRQTLEPILLEAMQSTWRSATASSHGEDGQRKLTIAQAREALHLRYDDWAPLFDEVDSSPWKSSDSTPARLTASWSALARRMHSLLKEEGSTPLQSMAQPSTGGPGLEELWSFVFERCVLPWVREHGLSLTSAGGSDADILTEFAKSWVKELLHQLTTAPAAELSQFFFNIENEASATWAMPDGSLTVHGQLDSCWAEIHPGTQGPEGTLLTFRLANESPLPTQIVECVLTMLLAEHTGNFACHTGRLYLLSAVPTESAANP